jgi:hypothetical protein
MMHYDELASIASSSPVSHAEQLRLAVGAYVARFKGASHDHTYSDLRCYLLHSIGHLISSWASRNEPPGSSVLPR